MGEYCRQHGRTGSERQRPGHGQDNRKNHGRFPAHYETLTNEAYIGWCVYNWYHKSLAAIKKPIIGFDPHMHKIILTPTAFILILFVSSCIPARMGESVGTPQPLTTADLDGKWKSEYGFYILFEEENGSFSGSYDQQSADTGLGI